jgi:hypothetical protein
MVESTYEVHLTSDATGGSASVESPVRTDRIDFYDSGVWVDQEPGRVFCPYSKIQVVRQRPADTGSESDESVGEEADSATSTTEQETVEE